MSATSWAQEVLDRNPAEVEFSGSAGDVSDHAWSLIMGCLGRLSEQTQPAAH